MEEKETNVITINNTEYTEIERINYNNETYIILADLDNPEDFMIKKIIIENNEEYITAIESREEFDKILNLFINKYAN